MAGAPERAPEAQQLQSRLRCRGGSISNRTGLGGPSARSCRRHQSVGCRVGAAPRREGGPGRARGDVLDPGRRQDDGRIGSNPATKTDNLPEITKRPNVYLTGEQLHALARESGRYRSLVLLLGTAGLRWGEAVSLRVADVQDRRLVIHKNATGGTTGTPKGGDHRTLVLAQYVVDELAITVAGKADSDLIWPSQTGGHLKPPGSHDSWLSGAVRRCQRIAEAARIAEQKAEVDRKLQTPVFPRITAHDLRHTAASLAVQSGANVKVIQRMLGHKSAAMTLDVYADHLTTTTAAADKLDQSVLGKLWAPAPETGDRIGVLTSVFAGWSLAPRMDSNHQPPD